MQAAPREGYTSMENFNKPEPPASLGFFTFLVLVIQGLGLAAVILVAVWMGHFHEGFAWQTEPKLEFNYHPVFMVIGMIFLYTDAILAYRVFRNMKKIYIKVLHASIQVAALIFASVGLKAVFDSHNLENPPFKNLYSLHSWLGLSTVILFGLQWVCGFISFLFPRLSLGMRQLYMPNHVFWGLAIFGMAVAAALTGIMEKVTFISKDIGYPNLPSEALVVNCLGLVIVALALCVFFVVTRPEYKRQSTPDEEHIQLTGE
ncbi:hypothetical protein CHS0354_031511 [Potamilus streckersoni]|uniref:Cytochrome b561 domain-containing protein n=1 Tax=Potamilus streckersoni TaxID=2493646 RepID=A0AAE0VVZ1_9BIVA|nr:hypothetical protein CHS0354_031511 [Potamilus streckersoni]